MVRSSHQPSFINRPRARKEGPLRLRYAGQVALARLPVSIPPWHRAHGRVPGWAAFSSAKPALADGWFFDTVPAHA